MARKTKQKEILENTLEKTSSFFTAEDIHNKVSGIGIATIYRFLKDLKKKGKIHSYTCNRKTIYSTRILNHCHFTCEKCHKTEHIHLEKLDFLKNMQVCHFQLDVSGICKKCKD